MTNALPDRARVQPHDGFLLVELEGDPYERGRQHGAALRDRVRLFRDSLYGDIIFKRGKTLGAVFTAVLYGIASRMHPYIPRELRAEMRGVADGAAISYRDVLLFNAFDDIMHGLILLNPTLAPIMSHRFVAPLLGRFSPSTAGLACSSFVLSGSRTESGRPIHGRNMDYDVADAFVDPDGLVSRILRQHVVVFLVRPSRGRPYVSVSWPGFVGAVTAMNADGLSLACLTSTVPRETVNGIPLPLLYRLMAQYCGSLDEAEWLLRGARRTIGNHLVLAHGPTDEARLLEFTMERVARVEPRDGVLLTTNHFQHPGMLDLQAGWVIANSEFRLARLVELFARGGPEAPSRRFSSADAEAALTDTCPVDRAETDWDCLQNPGTIYSTVADPARLTLSVRVHDRAERSFVELDLADRLGVRGVAAAA